LTISRQTSFARIKREIIDNETDQYTMGQFLCENISENYPRVDIATGYFNPSGFGILRSALWDAAKSKDFRLRLLFGRDAIHREYEKSEVLGTGGIQPTFVEELDSLQIGSDSAKLIDDLVAFLKQDAVQIRRNPQRFNHAKCYILDELVAIGSSNLTGSGLARNVELNAVLYQPSAQQQVREWFERRWNEGQDEKSGLIKILEESKFGLPLNPFLAYMKFLYEYYKIRLQEQEERDRGRLELAAFQSDAVKAALRIIKKYNGVIIADSTGLGKTHIGLEILHELVAVQRKKALLLAPRQVINTVWEQKLLDSSIKTRNESIESTGTSRFRPEEFLDYDVVLIDESHNYRNPSTKRRLNLMKLLSGGKRKQVILMTATPVNNSLMDLYHQISLITGGDDAHFSELDIPDLRNHFISADKKRLASGVEDIVRLLDEIMIRRTRQFIKENYPEATINGKPVTFPKRKLKKVEYALTQIFGTTIYSEVLNTIDGLNLVPYRIVSYREEAGKDEREQAEHRATLQKYGLLKRFESSVEAIRKSIGRLIEFYELFDKAVENGRVLDSKSFHELLADAEDEEEEEENDEKVYARLSQMMSERLPPLTGEYNVAKMRRDIREDLNRLRPLQKGLNNIHPYSDRKLSRLKELFDEDRIFETGGKKVVIFTQFVDTARYLHEELKSVLKDYEVRILTGDTDEATRKRILEGFAPKANNAPPGTNQIDVLVSTDVLSEGQNLQDANYCINYDLPWNPMKIVQRVGRIDRLMNDFDEVTAAVFIPEKELEDLLKLLEKLESKIQKVSDVVGIESTILGEKENPRNFNALERIRANDDSLLDEMERSSELLPALSPFQFIWTYMKKIGKQKLESIPLGKRSGKACDVNGMVLFYREKKNMEGMHLLYYDYDRHRLDHINDVSWIFQKIQCGEDEPLKIPVEGYEAFRQFSLIDEQARIKIISEVNSPYDAKEGLKIKPKHQRELLETILDLFKQGKIPKNRTTPIYEILLKQNLVAWEVEFAEFIADYKKNKNADALLSSVDTLIQKYKIEKRESISRKKLEPDDLIMIGYIFLSKASATFPMVV
jgi:superfamily II DNA or RNA helicase